MADERDIRRARRAELEALIAEHGTDAEQATVGWSALGLTLTQLAAAAAGSSDHPPATQPPDRKLVARITRRIAIRRRLGIEVVDCVAGLETGCDCLGETLDQIDESADKRKVLAAARKLHRARHPRSRPQPVPPAQAEHPAAAAQPITPPAPIPEVVTQTNTRPARVIKRTPKWFDEPERRRSIMDMQF
jgi:hypothetical protein